MSHDAQPNRRILVVDDSMTIQRDFQTILKPVEANKQLAQAEEELFGDAISPAERIAYELDCAQQGEEGLEMVFQSLQEQRPYALAFVDVRMPPGIDGIETLEKMFAMDARIHAVLCTAYSDHSWASIIDRLGQSDRLLILKKPFDAIEIRQLALAMTKKWQLQLQADQKRDEIQQWLDELNDMVGTKNAVVTSPVLA
jgi:CheY-like chemotaxis protein